MSFFLIPYTLAASGPSFTPLMQYVEPMTALGSNGTSGPNTTAFFVQAGDVDAPNFVAGYGEFDGYACFF